jgi:predicted nuclease with TOPRIM domain
MDSYVQIIVTIVGVLGSASVWKYLETRLKTKTEIKKDEFKNSDSVQYRDDLKDRVRNLEQLLAQSADEKDDLRNQILALTAEVNALRVKVEFLSEENKALKYK